MLWRFSQKFDNDINRAMCNIFLGSIDFHRVLIWCHDYTDNTYCNNVKKISDISKLYYYYQALKGIFKIEQIKKTMSTIDACRIPDTVQSKPKLTPYKIMKVYFEAE